MLLQADYYFIASIHTILSNANRLRAFLHFFKISTTTTIYQNSKKKHLLRLVDEKNVYTKFHFPQLMHMYSSILFTLDVPLTKKKKSLKVRRESAVVISYVVLVIIMVQCQGRHLFNFICRP